MDRLSSSETKGEQIPFLDSATEKSSIPRSKKDSSGRNFSLANNANNSRHRFTETSPFGVKNFTAASSASSASYGAAEDAALSPTIVSSSSKLDSNSELHSRSYQPEGVLFRISDLHPDQVFQKEVRNVATRLSCRSVEDDLEEDSGPTPQLNAFLELEKHHDLYEEYKLPQNTASLGFSNLLHDLYELQGHFAPAYFREHASLAIKNKTTEKQALQEILAEKKQCHAELQKHSSSHGEDFADINTILQEEIAHLEKKLASLDVFIAYHQKALAVNRYLDCYNQLVFYPSFQPEKRFDQFEAATQKLQPALAYSQEANRTLLDCIPETKENKASRDIFEKIAARDFEENPFEVALCPGGGNFTPTTQANQWTCQRLQRDLRLSLKEGHCPEPPGCVIQ